MAPPRGRFAPSPSGALHLGTARTALIAWRRARQSGGAFFMRVDDLDTPRVRPGAEAAILDDLAWLGVEWDGEVLRQSERLGLYADVLAHLKTLGLAYPCSCSRKDIIHAASAPHLGDEGPAYPGTCRHGPTRPDLPFAWRFRMPDAGDDFVLQRADGIYAYQLACAVDDAAMEINEVVRGDDLRGSAILQTALLKALGHAIPSYFHVPLMLGPDGQRLAKRHGAIAVADYRAQGFTPKDVIALLGDLNSMGGSI